MTNPNLLIKILATRIIQEDPSLINSPLNTIDSKLFFTSEVSLSDQTLSSSIKQTVDKLPTDQEIQNNLSNIIGPKSCDAPQVLKFRYLKDPNGNIVKPPENVIYDTNADGLIDILDFANLISGTMSSTPYVFNNAIIESYCDGLCDDLGLKRNLVTGKCECQDEEIPGPGNWITKEVPCPDNNGTHIIYECPFPYSIITSIENNKTVTSCKCAISDSETYTIDPQTCQIICRDSNKIYNAQEARCVCNTHIDCSETNSLNVFSPIFDEKQCSCSCNPGLVAVEYIPTGGASVKIKCQCPDIVCDSGYQTTYNKSKSQCECVCSPPYKEIIDFDGFKRCCLDDWPKNCKDSSVNIIFNPCATCVCAKNCPPNSKPVLTFDYEKNSLVCECECDAPPPECIGKIMTDSKGIAKVWLSPNPPIPCKGTIPAEMVEIQGEPCSCLWKDVDPSVCSSIANGVPPEDFKSGLPSFPYTGKIDPRTGLCEKICSEGCYSQNPTPETLDLFERYGVDYNNETFNNCTVPGFCCVPKPVDPDDFTSATSECSAFCDPEQKTQCCSKRIDIMQPFYGFNNLTFCCEECEECVDNQSWNARCEKKANCSGSYAPQLLQNISILGYNFSNSIELF